MNREKLRSLLESYDPAIRQVITRVLLLEQEHIDLERPRVKDKIESIIKAVATQHMARDPEAAHEA